jgi:single-stranded-DNA-specific exonuclease
MTIRERAVDAQLVKDLAHEGFSSLQARLLALRGVTKENYADFLSPSLAGLVDSCKLPGIIEAADIILDAVRDRSKIVVFGDYDCDGVCASAILVSCLKTLGAEVVYFIPDRLSEGYGMSEKSVARMLKTFSDVKLVITVDNGITSVSEIEELKKLGVTCIITDHHLPGDVLPDAAALVNPKVKADEDGLLSDLCGAGVAFMLARRLVDEAKKRALYSGGSIGGPMLILAGLATVTDIMPLSGQNRILVFEALRRFHACAASGIKELYLRAATKGAKQLGVKDFGFLLGPRINAAGRIANASEAIELLLSEDREVLREIARKVDGYNLERKRIESEMTEAALKSVVQDAPAQVIEITRGHKGVAGIVASRVMEKLGDVPVCVCVDGRGSARSPVWLNIRDAMENCSRFLDRFGGHAAAGGFQVKEGAIDDFRAALCEYCELVKAGRPTDPEIHMVDAVVLPQDLTLEFAQWLKKLEPFGEGNPEPVFSLKGLMLAEVKPLGQEARHLQIRFRERGVPRAVWWNGGEEIERLRRDSHLSFDITFSVVVSDYGDRHVELQLQKINPTAEQQYS